MHSSILSRFPRPACFSSSLQTSVGVRFCWELRCRRWSDETSVLWFCLGIECQHPCCCFSALRGTGVWSVFQLFFQAIVDVVPFFSPLTIVTAPCRIIELDTWCVTRGLGSMHRMPIRHIVGEIAHWRPDLDMWPALSRSIAIRETAADNPRRQADGGRHRCSVLVC